MGRPYAYANKLSSQQVAIVYLTCHKYDGELEMSVPRYYSLILCTRSLLLTAINDAQPFLLSLLGEQAPS